MDPTTEEKQNDQAQEKRSGGGIGQGINAINKLVRGELKNPLGKIGSRVALQTALRGLSAFLASPAGLPILIAMMLVVVFTIIIVGFGGTPPLESNNQAVNAPPTEPPTPPAVP